MKPYSLYLIDDEESIREGVSFGLQEDYRLQAFSCAEKALASLPQDPPDLILLDIGLPGMDGIQALEKIKEISPHIMVIMITAYEDLDTVIKAMKAGAHDYILKPLQMEGLRHSIANALETIRIRKEIQTLQEKYLKENTPFFVGNSKTIVEVMQIVNKVAQSPDTSVMIVGESGTGKELIANAIHYKSPNFKGPLVILNCAAIPKDLLESELFGYERGAFSGAVDAGKKGLAEEAEGGTLLLDEVGDLSLEAQAKLLRFLETGEYYRVGGTTKHHVRTRFVSATNKNIPALIEEGLFREDLFYRLAVVKLEMPSLAERREDIIPMAEYFLTEFGHKYKKKFVNISANAKDLLKNRLWKGNIRELRNIIERGVLLEDGPQLQLPDLDWPQSRKPEKPGMHKIKGRAPEFTAFPESGLDLKALNEHLISEALKKAGGCDRLAAKLLGMSYYAFRYQRRKLSGL